MVFTMHGFSNAGYIVTLGLLSLIGSMAFWFRDVVAEGTAKCLSPKVVLFNYTLNIAKAITEEEIKLALDYYYKNINNLKISKDQLGYYLAGLLEGDGSISLPAIGNTTLNRVLNPRIIFTSHINNLGFYAYIQSELGGIGRFQLSNKNTIRYIIGDIKGILLIINLINGKLRTPKNQTFNKLIDFINKKYSLNIQESILDKSNLASNSWFTGFTEADGYFGVKIIEAKPKSDTRKRSVSTNISLIFRLDQRSWDKPTSSHMLPIMNIIAKFLMCNLLTYSTKESGEILSISISRLESLKYILFYFNKYPLLGIKSKDFKDWEIVYYMIVHKEHLTEEGRLKIKSIRSNMNKNRTI